MIPTFEELWNSIPEDRRSDKIRQELVQYYDAEWDNMEYYMKKAKEPRVFMGTFQDWGSQLIADFSVSDAAKPDNPDQLNWHMQNTSQWLYAGCICIQDNKVSTHH